MFYEITKLRYFQTNFNNDFHDSQVVPYHTLKSLRPILLLTPCISYLPISFYYLKKVDTCKLRANKIKNRVILDQLYTKQMSFHWWIVLIISTAGSKKWFKTQTLSKWCCLSQHILYRLLTVLRLYISHHKHFWSIFWRFGCGGK